MKKAEGRMQNAEAPLPPQAARLAAQSQIGNRKSQILGWLLAAMLVLGTFATFWPATRGDFVNYDDGPHVTANVQVQKGLTWESLKWAWFNPVNCNWHPITVLSHMVDYQLFGLKPWGHHLTSVLLHALNAGLVFGLLQRMTGAAWRSLLVAALFALHPLRVESVAWVSERKDVLSGFFGLLALLAYARYVGSPKSEVRTPKEVRNPKCEMGDAESVARQHNPQSTFHASTLPALGFYALSILFFALGLMSKPMLVTLPFVLLLLDYWPLGRMQNAEATDRQYTTRNTDHVSRFTFHLPLPLFLEKLPFFALAAAASVVTFLVQKQASAVMEAERLSVSSRAANALISYGRYLGKLLWPTDLAVYYPHPGHWPWGTVALSGGLILGLSLLVFLQRWRHPYLLVGWLWFVGTLVPVIGLVQVGAQAMADRYTYLPSLGVLLLAVWGAHELTQGKAEVRGQRTWGSDTQHVSRTRVQSQIANRKSQILLWVAVVLCPVLTREQITYWKDSEALFRHALEVTQNNTLAHNGLGVALDEKGQIDEAIRQLQEALRLSPDNADVHYNLGVAFFQQGRTAEAIRQFQETIRLRPNHAEAHNNLGTALGRQGQTAEAIHQYQEALRLKPDYAEARKNLDILLGTKAHQSPPE
jgi:protein O-mannosyl-transferase